MRYAIFFDGCAIKIANNKRYRYTFQVSAQAEARKSGQNPGIG
jgi:hypothetical protein